MNFVNLTPHTVTILDSSGGLISKARPSGSVAFAAPDAEKPIHVPPPETGKVYVVLPAVAAVSDRTDLVSIEPEAAERSQRGNVRTHVCHWTRE